ncbi:hypothetical protein M2451_002948 [Dysgonomonas sp. PFB1-18]|nr:hypothetical protein [Dysgonomonas sp. PF1-14]MDH6339967.1 hypothetical protein [Dysgonomonas sp. PF1-16]MDH6381615.1 hypothetical protein [Dysgonomonas sp. PFB1-18]MDH6398748.1 hypothetical protein [Dysgonomonas sp. PF1-23]
MQELIATTNNILDSYVYKNFYKFNFNITKIEKYFISLSNH